jgi:hypothetical protein
MGVFMVGDVMFERDGAIAAVTRHHPEFLDKTGPEFVGR